MKKNLSVAAVATVVMIVLLRWQGSGLQTTISPHGIVDLEFAGSPLRLQQLVQAWHLSEAKVNIWLDFLFIVSYVMFLSIATELCAMKWPAGIMREVGLTLIRVAYMAGLLDIAENLLMLQSLAGIFTTTSLQLTSYCAAVKFTLAALILVYLIVSLPVAIRKNKD
jgi:hypothetical protein